MSKDKPTYILLDKIVFYWNKYRKDGFIVALLKMIRHVHYRLFEKNKPVKYVVSSLLYKYHFWYKLKHTKFIKNFIRKNLPYIKKTYEFKIFIVTLDDTKFLDSETLKALKQIDYSKFGFTSVKSVQDIKNCHLADYNLIIQNGDKLNTLSLKVLNTYINLYRGKVDLLFTDEDRYRESILGTLFLNPIYKVPYPKDYSKFVRISYGVHILSRNYFRKILDKLDNLENLFNLGYILSSNLAPSVEKTVYVNYILYHRKLYKGVNRVGNFKINDLSRKQFNNNIDSKKVSIIIPTKDNYHILKRCIDSLIRYTVYPDYEVVIIDNGSKDIQTKAYLQNLKKKDKVTVLNYDIEFNFSKLCNFGAKHANGDIFVFLNDDVVITDKNWLQRLVYFTSFSDVGCVGPVLLYPNGRIQHAGIVIRDEFGVNHIFKYMKPSSAKYLKYLEFSHEVLAVTGACLVVSKDKFYKARGFEEKLPTAFNDVVLNLRLWRLGFRSILVPDVRLVHLESYSRKSLELDELRKLEEYERILEREIKVVDKKNIN